MAIRLQQKQLSFYIKLHLYLGHFEFWACTVTVSPDRKQTHSKGVQQLWEAMANSPKETKEIKEWPGCFKYLPTFTGIQVLWV